MKIISNNKKVLVKYGGDSIEGEYLDVLLYARDLVHQNYELVTHPLSGSIKPYETIFKTIILKEGDCLHLPSLQIIEDSIVTTQKFLRNRQKIRNWNDKELASIVDDLEVIDLSLVESALSSLGVCK